MMVFAIFCVISALLEMSQRSGQAERI